MEGGRVVFIDSFFRPLTSFVTRRLNARSLEGYSYGGAAPIYVKRVIGGGVPNGAYLDRVMFRLKPCEKGSFFRTWNVDFLSRKAQLLEEEIDRIGRLEASHGYSLVEAIPISSFVAEGIGPGTRSLFLVFENEEGSGMFDRWSLKERKEDGDEVICPVVGCRKVIPRMAAAGPNLDWDNEKLADYYCPRHRIYVSPSTFEYKDKTRPVAYLLPLEY